MKYYVGLNVSMKETSICIIEDKENIIAKESILIDPDDTENPTRIGDFVHLIYITFQFSALGYPFPLARRKARLVGFRAIQYELVAHSWHVSQTK